MEVLEQPLLRTRGFHGDVSVCSDAQIFFSEMKYSYIEAQEAYTSLSLLCDIGGALGLILGSTMLTFCEFTDFFISQAVAWFRIRASTGVVAS